MKVCIIGTGYVGLTTGTCLAFLGHEVTCVDSDQRKVDMLCSGHIPIYEPFLTELLVEARTNLKFQTDDARALETLYRLYRPVLDQSFATPSFMSRPEGLGAVPLISTDLASAELIKYAANAFLALKISYINEIGQLSEKVGADIVQVARGIGLDARIGTRFLQAGIGWGGSCFGKDTAGLGAT